MFSSPQLVEYGVSQSKRNAVSKNARRGASFLWTAAAGAPFSTMSGQCPAAADHVIRR
jgi:hypothetical protein